MDLHSSHTRLLQIIQSLFKKEIIYALSFLFILYLNLTVPFLPQSLFQTSLSSKFFPKNQNLDTQDCDYSKGKWVLDENNLVGSYDERCQFLDPGFRCHRNGRKDNGYLKWRWQPEECDLPRFNASDLLERTRNGRIVFAGDSIGRNQWESLICMLAKAVSNQTNIYEQNGSPITKHKGYLSIRFHEYNLTVEYYRVPFLVTRDRPPQNYSNKVRSTIRVDHLHWRSEQWVGADILIFNAGHWWNKDKTVKMGCYFQEGRTVNMTMNVMEAFRRSLETWRSWVIQSMDPKNSYIFFRSYSPVHYREGTWNDGGRCDYDKEPETNYNKLNAEPWNNMFIYETIEKLKDVKRNVQFLNITYLTEFRNDGHPSIHREAGTPVPFQQDCSHWCLPGVPDTWNKLLYAHLLSKNYRTQNSRKYK